MEIYYSNVLLCNITINNEYVLYILFNLMYTPVSQNIEMTNFGYSQPQNNYYSTGQVGNYNISPQYNMHTTPIKPVQQQVYRDTENGINGPV